MATLWEGHDIGDVIATESVGITRNSLVRYAGASGDFNPIHYRDDVAKSVGLAVAPVTAWLGDRGFVSSYQVRFTKPVYVPAEGSGKVSVSVSVAKTDEPTEGSATLALAVTTEDGATVLGKAFVVVSPR
jgi:acyl dehydratase